MMMEHVDSRILAAFRFLDGETSQPITLPLTVSGSRVRLIRNRWGLYALIEAPGFEDYTSRFDKPPAPGPAPRLLSFTVIDPSGRHLSRSFSTELPREVSGEDPGRSVFVPVDVRMYPSPTARPSPGSAVVRLSLRDAETQAALLTPVVIRLRVTVPDGPTLEALGLSDERGEALLLVPRLPIIRWGQEEGDALVNTEFTATLAWASAPIVAGLPSPDMPAPSFTQLPQTLRVASGLELHSQIPIPTA